jgi:myo-inositol-1(or 4)-monophosphatase
LTENTCPEDVIIAGILHDVLEDTDTAPAEIIDMFGEDVLKIVLAESEDKSKSWRERKKTTVDCLVAAAQDVKMVCLADKLSNLRSMDADQKAISAKLWERFNAPKNDIEWYYTQIFEALSSLSQTTMYREFEFLLKGVFK